MFDYNNDGIVDVTHYYHLAGSQILSEEWTDTSEVTHLLVYNYDADGSIMGMSYRNSTYDVQRFDNYLFVKNIQGDVLHIYDENGNKIQSYIYDAWGNITSTTGSMASTVGKMNPFRYRGYYYDEELGFYYLNSRYYDPKIGRFINADRQFNSNIFGLNLFAYCNNNPINYVDYYGDDAIYLTDQQGAATMGHVGLLIQDAEGNWYHFNWSHDEVSLELLDGFTYTSFSALNASYLVSQNSILKTNSVNFHETEFVSFGVESYMLMNFHILKTCHRNLN